MSYRTGYRDAIDAALGAIQTLENEDFITVEKMRCTIFNRIRELTPNNPDCIGTPITDFSKVHGNEVFLTEFQPEPYVPEGGGLLDNQPIKII